VVQAAWAEKQHPIQKIMKVKRAGGSAQVVEHLPGKLKALSSNPTNTKKNERPCRNMRNGLQKKQCGNKGPMLWF
jgi:hypothetical protein